MERKDEGEICAYGSVGDVVLELDGKDCPDAGWVFFESTRGSHQGIAGVIGTIDNYVTIKLLHFMNTLRPLRIKGLFTYVSTGEVGGWRLDGVVLTGLQISDTGTFLGFRAVACKLNR
jgi:hypothetical protein